MRKILSFCFFAMLTTSYGAQLLATMDDESETIKTRTKSQEQIVLDHFSDEKYVYLYRGFGSTDYVFGNLGKFQILEVDKWFDNQGLAHGFKSGTDSFSESHIFSFTPTLVYAGRYTGGLMWDRAHGIIKIRIAKDLYKKYSQIGRDLTYNSDTPMSAHHNGSDVFETYMGPNNSLLMLPFIGTIYPKKGSIYDSQPIPLEKKRWATTCSRALPNGSCGAIEVRLTLKAVLEMAKASDPLVVERVSWNDYIQARRNYLNLKALFWKEGIEHVRKNFEAEAAVYGEVCGLDGTSQKASYCPLNQGDSETAFCAKVCDLHKRNPKTFLFTNEPTNKNFLNKISLRFAKAKSASRIENFCHCKP